MSNLEIIKLFISYLKAGEKEKAFSLIDDNAVWHSDEIGGPWSGTHKGKKAIQRHFIAMEKSIENVSKTIEDYIEKNDLIIELSTLKCTIKKTGKLFVTDLVCLYRVKNGKIFSYQVFENSLKLYQSYFPQNILLPKNLKICALTDEACQANYIFSLLEEKCYDVTVTSSLDELANLKDKKVICMATGSKSNELWKFAKTASSLRGIILLHPDKIDDFREQLLACPCLIIHSSSSKIASLQSLKSFDRARPEIPQFISDDLVDNFPIFEEFFTIFCSDDHSVRGEIIKNEKIQAMFPAHFPGAAVILNKSHLAAGMVKLEQYPSYEHSNMDEVMYMISGSAMFRHGGGKPERIEAGDIVYVGPYERHEWSEQTPDYCMLFVQIPRKVSPT